MHSTCNLDDGYMGSGKRLRYSIRKYGIDNHNKEILEFFENRDLLIEAEIKAITADMLLDKDCMNIVEGGTGGYGDRFLTKEQLIKGGLNMQSKFKGSIEQKKWSSKGGSEKFKLYGIPKNLKPNWNGKKHSDETKQKMSEARKGVGSGENNSQYGTCWITKDGTNKKIKKENLGSYLNEGWFKGRK
jgi:hypothetical protein